MQKLLTTLKIYVLICINIYLKKKKQFIQFFKQIACKLVETT